MSIYIIEIAQTAAAGVWSFNSLSIDVGICREIYVKAATATTTFDFTLTDEDNNVVYDTAELGKTATGRLYDFRQIPMKGIYTLACVGSSKNEAFTGRLFVDEK